MRMALPKTKITGKYFENRKNNLLETETILKPKRRLSGGPVFTNVLPVGAIRPSSSRQFSTSQTCHANSKAGRQQRVQIHVWPKYCGRATGVRAYARTIVWRGWQFCCARAWVGATRGAKRSGRTAGGTLPKVSAGNKLLAGMARAANTRAVQTSASWLEKLCAKDKASRKCNVSGQYSSRDNFKYRDVSVQSTRSKHKT